MKIERPLLTGETIVSLKNSYFRKVGQKFKVSHTFTCSKCNAQIISVRSLKGILVMSGVVYTYPIRVCEHYLCYERINEVAYFSKDTFELDNSQDYNTLTSLYSKSFTK